METNQVANNTVVNNNVQSVKTVATQQQSNSQNPESSSQSFLELFHSLLGGGSANIDQDLLSLIDITSPAKQAQESAKPESVYQAVQKESSKKDPEQEIASENPEQGEKEETVESESTDPEISSVATGKVVESRSYEEQNTSTATTLAVQISQQEKNVVQTIRAQDPKPVETAAVPTTVNIAVASEQNPQTPAAQPQKPDTTVEHQAVTNTPSALENSSLLNQTAEPEVRQEIPVARAPEVQTTKQDTTPRFVVDNRILEKEQLSDYSSLQNRGSSLVQAPRGTVETKTATPNQGVINQATILAQAAASSKYVIEHGNLTSAAQIQGGQVQAKSNVGGLEFLDTVSSGKRTQLPKADGGQRISESKLPINLVERIQQLMENARSKKEGNTIVLQLDPPELGNLMVKVSKRADQLFARITPESNEIEQAIRARIPEIVHALTGTGVKSENIHIAVGPEQFAPDMFSQNSDQGTHETFSSYSQSFAEHQKEDEASTAEDTLYLPPSPQVSVELGEWVA